MAIELDDESIKYLLRKQRTGGFDGESATEVLKVFGYDYLGRFIGKREYTQAQRDEYAKLGVAMPDGSYPIPDVPALKDAIQAYGRSPDAATKKHIKRRARALGRMDMLPAKWSKNNKNVTKAFSDDEARDDHGRWTSGGDSSSTGNKVTTFTLGPRATEQATLPPIGNGDRSLQDQLDEHDVAHGTQSHNLNDLSIGREHGTFKITDSNAQIYANYVDQLSHAIGFSGSAAADRSMQTTMSVIQQALGKHMG